MSIPLPVLITLLLKRTLFFYDCVKRWLNICSGDHALVFEIQFIKSVAIDWSYNSFLIHLIFSKLSCLHLKNASASCTPPPLLFYYCFCFLSKIKYKNFKNVNSVLKLLFLPLKNYFFKLKNPIDSFHSKIKKLIYSPFQNIFEILTVNCLKSAKIIWNLHILMT